MNSDEQKDFSGEQLRKKAERRRELANLPIEEKLKRLVKLQKVAYSVGMQAGRHPRKPWGTQK
ncbi:MAG: hypothetical protein C0469_08855 [Cyanobacteria bacterium DS2.3.42]|nr:hypothetical protein [Cyanobacteria bacterium DS2.3.42]